MYGVCTRRAAKSEWLGPMQLAGWGVQAVVLMLMLRLIDYYFTIIIVVF